MNRSVCVPLFALLLLGGVLLWSGCSKDSPTKSGKVTDEDRLQAQLKVSEAEGLWATAAVQAQETGGLPDFTAANASYEQALLLDPGNLDANFGAALTELPALVFDPDIQAMVTCLESMGPDSLGVLDNGIGGLPRPRFFRAEMLKTSYEVLFKLAATSVSCPPRVREVQSIVETNLIPRTDHVLELLAVVEGTPGFHYYLPPSMTGLPDSLEIDLGEVYLLDAILNTAKGLAYEFVAYDFDFDYQGGYDFLSDPMTAMRQIKYLLDESPTFGTLRSGSPMRSAKQALLAALNKAESCLASIRAETDDQSDDLIQAGFLDSLDAALPSILPGLTDFAQGIDSPEDIIAKIRLVLNGPYLITADLDGDEETPPQTITVNMAAMFESPVQDLRDLLPYHAWEPESEWPQTEMPFYFTDANGNRLDLEEGLLPVFPDYTFGGLFPGMTKARFEELFMGLGMEDLSKPLAKRRILMVLPAAG